MTSSSKSSRKRRIGPSPVNPNWISVILAVIVFGYSLYQDVQDRISFSYSIINTSPLIDTSFTNQEDQNLQIYYKNKLVNQPYSFTYQFKNTGRRDIDIDNFEEEIEIDFGTSNEILNTFISVPVGESEDLQSAIADRTLVNHENSKVRFSPPLMHAGEDLNIHVIVDSPDIGVIRQPTARISGIGSKKGIKRFFANTGREIPFLSTLRDIPKVITFLAIFTLSGLLTFATKKVAHFPRVSSMDWATSHAFFCLSIFAMIGAFTILLA